MSKFLVKGKHFITKHVWFEDANDIINVCGGEYRKHYNISTVCSLRAKLYTLLRKVFRK